MRRPCRESFSGRGGFYIISDLVERIVSGMNVSDASAAKADNAAHVVHKKTTES